MKFEDKILSALKESLTVDDLEEMLAEKRKASPPKQPRPLTYKEQYCAEVRELLKSKMYKKTEF